MIAQELLSAQLEQTRQLINWAERLRAHNLLAISWRPAPKSWSVLECLEHLNLYGDFYLPAIEKALRQPTTPREHYTPGKLGNYFAKSMLPSENMKAMRTFKSKDPIYADLNGAVIDRFIAQQHRFVELIRRARGANLQQVRVPISIAPFIKLQLGDVFQFLINHNLRHQAQAERVLARYETHLIDHPQVVLMG